MKNQAQGSPTTSVEQVPSYFELQASWGVTKHLGGAQATDELAARCYITSRSTVLDVGCGTGITACYLAAGLGCRVIGVDISDRMIAWSQRRARRMRLDAQVTFGVADAQQLPFGDNTFDAVVCESVTAFVPDPSRAVREYVRVTRPGGYVGLTEGAWLAPAPPELAAYLTRVMAGAVFQTPEAWQDLLTGAGLTDVVAQRYRVSAYEQWRGEMGRMGREDLLDYLQAWRTFLSLLATSAAFRTYIRTLWPPNGIRRMFDYFGYGICVGRK